MDPDTEVANDPAAGTTCGCGRVRATAHNFVRWCSAVSPDRPYGGSPSTWQNVRLGRCRPPNEAHLDPVYPAWALALCWTPGDRCQLPKASGLASDDPDAARVRDFDEAAARYCELRADLGVMVAAEVHAASAAADRAERCLDLHGYGCDRAECGRAPFAGVDRSTTPESLQRVADLLPVSEAIPLAVRARWDRWRAAQGR